LVSLAEGAVFQLPNLFTLPGGLPTWQPQQPFLFWRILMASIPNDGDHLSVYTGQIGAAVRRRRRP
jgi:hypothetical protein